MYFSLPRLHFLQSRKFCASSRPRGLHTGPFPLFLHPVPSAWDTSTPQQPAHWARLALSLDSLPLGGSPNCLVGWLPLHGRSRQPRRPTDVECSFLQSCQALSAISLPQAWSKGCGVFLSLCLQALAWQEVAGPKLNK